MPASLEPIDPDGMAFSVVLDGERIGIVTRYITMGGTIWLPRVVEDAPPVGGFTEAQEAADHLALTHVSRKKRDATND